MADRIDILHKRSSIENKIPTPDILKYGEIAININDGNLFFKKTDNTVAEMKRLDTRLNECDIIRTEYNDIEDITEIEYSTGNIIKFLYNEKYDMIKATYHGIDGFTHLYSLYLNYDEDGNFSTTQWVKE